jgi:hypothetical protein
VGNDEDERGGNEAGVAWDGSCDGLSTRARDRPWTAEPVGARGAIVGGVERDDFLPIGAEVLLDVCERWGGGGTERARRACSQRQPLHGFLCFSDQVQ